MKKGLRLIFSTLLSFLIMTNSYSQNYDNKFFPIGIWSIKGDFRSVDDHLYDKYKAAKSHREHFSDLHSRGFNSIYMSLDPIVYTLDTILDIAQEYDMKVISNLSNLNYLISGSNDNDITGDDIRKAILDDSIYLLKRSPATLGYYIYDEPLPGWIDFDILKQAKDSLISLTSGNHPVLSSWNDVRHMDYIDSYLDLDVLMADAYPFSDSTSEGSLADYMPAYFSNWGDPDDPSTIGPATPGFSEYIEMIRQQQCNTKNRPLWMIFQSFGDVIEYDPDDSEASWAFWRQVKPKEIRLQVWISVMQGAKGLWYFLYESEYPGLMGMLDLSGQPTIRLEEATAVNSQINKISDILLKLQVIENANLSISSGEARMHLDTSSSSNDNVYMILTNTNYYNQQKINITVDKSEIGYQVNSIRDKVNDIIIPVNDNGNEIKFTVNLDRADGSLYQFSSEMPDKIEETVSSHSNSIIYPNPAAEMIYFKTGFGITKKVRIFNQYGQKVFDVNTSANQLDISGLNEGVYNILITINNRLIRERFVVSR